MRLNLKELVNESKKFETIIEIKERIPSHIADCGSVHVCYQITRSDDFYLLELHTEANLTISCQRCMEETAMSYQKASILAVCNSDLRAEQIMQDYECIVSSFFSIDLEEIITDELHLYSPQFHLDSENCNNSF